MSDLYEVYILIALVDPAAFIDGRLYHFMSGAQLLCSGGLGWLMISEWLGTPGYSTGPLSMAAVSVRSMRKLPHRGLCR